MMRFCNKCGEQLDEGMSFCQKCGTKQEIIDSNNDTTNTSSINTTKLKPKKITKKEGCMLTIAVILLLVTLFAYMNKNNANKPTPAVNNTVTNSPITTSQQKYNIKNLGTAKMTDADFEQLYEKAKNSSFSWIDSLNEEDYLPVEQCSVTIFDDNSAAFLLKTVNKKGVDDNSVLVTFKYLQNEKKWQRLEIVYNKKEYGN